MRSMRARTYASHACAAGAKKGEKSIWREGDGDRTEKGTRYREMETRKEEEARIQDRLQPLEGGGGCSVAGGGTSSPRAS